MGVETQGDYLMSYDIRLVEPVSGNTIEFDNKHEIKGGTYAIGGTTEAWLNITYNYGKFYREVYPKEGIRCVYGKSGAESIPMLEHMIKTLQLSYPEASTSSDYWDSCPGNALVPLHQLIAMAKFRPDGIWEGD